MNVTPLAFQKRYINPGVNKKKNSLPSSIQSHSPSFKSTPIYNVCVFKPNEDDNLIQTQASFSRIERKNSEDALAMKNIKDKFEFGDRYGIIIRRNFFACDNEEMAFFIVETKDKSKETPLSDRILSMAEIEIRKPKVKNQKSYMKIDFIQSMQDVPFSGFHNTKGGGELCLYGLVKLAKKIGLDYIELFSTNDDFYDHLHFGRKRTLGNISMYNFDSSLYDDFLKRVEIKYNFKG